MELYLQIGALMEKHGMTNQTMTNLTGIPLGTVSGIRSGKIQCPSFDNVCAMMKAMGESIDALVGIVPPPVEVNEEKLTEDGYTESEIKAILRWAGSEIARNYQAIVASLEARIAEKDERLSHRTSLRRMNTSAPRRILPPNVSAPCRTSGTSGSARSSVLSSPSPRWGRWPGCLL